MEFIYNLEGATSFLLSVNVSDTVTNYEHVETCTNLTSISFGLYQAWNKYPNPDIQLLSSTPNHRCFDAPHAKYTPEHYIHERSSTSSYCSVNSRDTIGSSKSRQTTIK